MKVNLIDISNYEHIQNTFHLDSFVSKIFASMNLNDKQINEILNDKRTLFDYDTSFLKPILDRLYQAKINKEKIFIAGDYDCDGICATTILYDALKRYGIECGYYIPNRFNEGYGLNTSTVSLVKEKGYDIIITVDNGVSATEALKMAKDLGIEIILTDHHNYDESNIIYDYFLHPNILPDDFKYMCGAGLSYLIASNLIGCKQEHVILAGMATIADIVPLWGINRKLILEAIHLLNCNLYPQVQLLANDKKIWDAHKIAFQIVPKINSVGRLADEANANTVVKYFLMNDIVQIENFCKQLKLLNNKRKKLSDDLNDLAFHLVEDDKKFQVLHHSSFHEGINGIIASKVSKTTLLPVMCLAEKEDKYVGSIRSDSIDLRTFFDDLDILTSYGGHKQAAGISFYKKDLDVVKSYIHQNIINEDINVELHCLYLNSNELNIQNFEKLKQFEPYGQGFSIPMFITKEDTLESCTISAGKHLKLFGKNITYLYFDHGTDKFLIKDFSKYCYIGNIEINEFNHTKSLNMIVDKMVENVDL